MSEKICLIGFGEVGQILGEDLAKIGDLELSAWDSLFSDANSAPSQGLLRGDVTAGTNGADAASGADIVISAVTAAGTVDAAAATAGGLGRGAWYLDLNSASPGMKLEAAQHIDDAGGRYVEASVMSPFPAKRLATPMLIGGPHAQDFLPVATRLGLDGVRHFSTAFGQASAAKMCRSVVVKGVEALLTESLLTARRHGVEDTVLDSLSDLLPGPDWRALSHYMITRTLEHGERRAEEMREAARTVAEAGIEPMMSDACAKRQDWGARHRDALAEPALGGMLDTILQTLEPGEETSSR